MSFRGDLEFHKEKKAKILERFRGPRARIQMKAEREGDSSGSHFVEFWERGEPSKPGLLLTDAEWWTVVVGNSIFGLEIAAFRKYCYGWRGIRPPAREPYWIRGGDDKEFVGVLVNMSAFGAIARDLVTGEERLLIDRETRRYIAMPAPRIPENMELQFPSEPEPEP